MVRASITDVRFTQVIKRIIAAKLMSIIKGCEYFCRRDESPLDSDLNSILLARYCARAPGIVAGCTVLARMPGHKVDTSALACVKETPCLRRPVTLYQPPFTPS